MSQEPTFYSHLYRSMGNWLTEILREPSLNPFRRTPQVKLGAPSSPFDEDFHLVYAGKRHLDSDKGTFTVAMEEERLLVFRAPVRMAASFVLMGGPLAAPHVMRAYDRLTTYFFDNRTMDPFLPEAFRSYPALYARLSAHKAELALAEEPAALGAATEERTERAGRLRLGLVYTALYHSGSPLREETRVTSRVIDYQNDKNGPARLDAKGSVL